MIIGNLKHKISIYEKSNLVLEVEQEDDTGGVEVVEVQQFNELGQNILEDSVLGQPFAEVIPKTGSLLSGRAGDTVLSKTTHLFRIRYNKKYEFLKNTQNWIIHKGKRFDIDFILNPYSKNESLEIFCTEVI